MNAFVKLLRWLAWTVLVMVLASLVVSALVVGVVHEFAPDLAQASQWHVSINGEDLGGILALPASVDAGAWSVVGLLAGIAAAVFCALVVLPLALLLGLGLPLLGLLIAFGAVVASLAGVTALIAAPLLLPILLVVWLMRRDRRPTATNRLPA